MSDVNRVTISTPAPAVGERPKCPGCGCELTPQYVVTREDYELPSTRHEVNNGRQVLVSGGRGSRITDRKWNGRYDGYGHFHSMRCAVGFANRLVDRLRNIARVSSSADNRAAAEALLEMGKGEPW